MQRDNYYILLDLDPAEKDPAKIELAITAKQREWASLRNHPSQGNWAKQSLSQIPKIRRTLLSTEKLRQVEAEEAVKLNHSSNFFIMLNLNPFERDSAKIEAAIGTKLQEWARLRNHPSKGTWAKQCLSKIPKIRQTLMTEELRKAEAEKAIQLLHIQQEEQLATIDKALSILTAKGYISEKELDTLSKAFKSFDRKDVEKRIKVPIKKETAKAAKDKINPLDASTAKKIESDLDIVQKKDLYDFLEMKSSSTIRALQKKIYEQYTESRKKSVKNAHFTATQELLGQCRRIFKDEDYRKRYHETLDQSRFASLDKLINYAGYDGDVSASEFEKLVKEGTDMGLAKEETIDHIKQYAAGKRWSVTTPGKGSTLHQSIACGVCNTLNKPDAKNCTSCKFPLKVDCPKCRTSNPSSTVYCSNCGYSIADMPNALPLLQDATNALSKSQYELAEQLFRKADTYWKNHPATEAGLKKIRELKKRLKDIEKERIQTEQSNRKREIDNKVTFLKERVINLITDDKLGDVISYLRPRLIQKSDYHRDLISLKRALKQSIQSSSRGIISREQYLMEKSKVANDLLEIIMILEVQDFDLNNLENVT